MTMWNNLDIEGKTIKEVKINESDEINFLTEDGSKYRMVHHQDCCELVYIAWDRSSSKEKIKGLVGQKIISVSEESSEYLEASESGTLTIYTINDVKIVWIGESNGYYGETPYFEKY